MLNLLHAALVCARAGWPVFPLHAPRPHGGCTCGHACGATGKHPHTSHGLRDASTAPGQIVAWWRRWPEANVGLVTGAVSGLVVLDVDARHGGEGSLARLEATYDRLPPTLTTQTGGGGRHYLFAHPGGGRIPNATCLFGWPGLDLRGDGGYIVAPPSLHASGRRYAWLDERLPLAPLPAWLLELRLAPVPRPHLPLPARPLPQHDAGAYWLARALEQARPGVRNALGFWLSCQLRDAGLSQAEAEPVLLAYAAAVPAGDHPYPSSEALESLRSAYRTPAREPARRR
jgi:hypothetical protein